LHRLLGAIVGDQRVGQAHGLGRILERRLAQSFYVFASHVTPHYLTRSTAPSSRKRRGRRRASRRLPTPRTRARSSTVTKGRAATMRAPSFGPMPSSEAS